MSRPTFYIVTPSFNQVGFLAETIESVLAQNMSTTHWIIDGQSTDKTVLLLKKYGSKLHWLSEPDKGQTDAINKGIKKILATARPNDIFAYLNSDDYYLLDCFAKVVANFSLHPEINWLVGDAMIVDEKGREIHTWIKIYKRVLRFFPLRWTLLVGNPVPQPSVFIRIKALQTCGKFDDNLHFTMDYDYWLRLLSQEGEPIKLKDELSAFRIHSKSKGVIAFNQQFNEGLEVARRYGNNKLLLWAHELHVKLTCFVYSKIK